MEIQYSITRSMRNAQPASAIEQELQILLFTIDPAKRKHVLELAIILNEDYPVGVAALNKVLLLF